MSKNKKTNPTIRKIIICVVALLLVMSILGGGCATVAGKLGLKDLFPNIGFIPFYPDEEKPSNSESETVKETDEESESTSGEGDQEPKPPDMPDPPESIEGDVNTSGGGSESASESIEDGTNPGESESNPNAGEKPGESESESTSESEKPGESESESTSESEKPGESESESTSGSESESEKPGESESESESEKPGESESESTSESGSTPGESESTSESLPTDVITYKFNGVDLILNGNTNISYTHDKVRIEAISSLDSKLKTNEITIITIEDYQIVRIVLVCDIRYEFTIEITPGSSTVQQFEDGTITIDVNEDGTAQVTINFSRNVEIITLEVSISN